MSRRTRIVVGLYACLVTLAVVYRVWFVSYPDVSIRVRNATGHDFDSVLIGFSGQREDFGRLESRTNSEYRRFSEAYSYGYVRVVTQNRTLEMRPIDYVGEVPLVPGRYTLWLRVKLYQGELDIFQKLVTDW